MDKKLEEVKRKIDLSKEIVITCHVSPDGDAIGSSLGLYHYLVDLGKKVTVVVPNDFPEFLKWFKGTKEIIVYENSVEKAKDIFEKADLLFALDFNETHRTAALKEIIDDSQAFKVLIDHHIGEPTWPAINLSVVGASSTCELVIDFILALSSEEKLNNLSVAYPLYTGMLTDTGNFQFSATTAKVHHYAGLLLAAGVEPDIVNNHINNSFDIKRLQFFGYCVSKKMTIREDLKLAYIPISKEEMKNFHIKTGGTEGLVNEPMKIANIEVSILIKEDENKVKMSFRSKGNIDVSTFAKQYFEGGGHRNAAGGVSYRSLSKTIEYLEEYLSYFNKA